MAGPTVLDNPAITNDIQIDDVLYLIRGTGVGRDQRTDGSRVRPTVVTANSTTTIDLSNYQGDLVIFSTPTANITITLSNILNDSRKLIIVNKSSSYKVTLAGASTEEILSDELIFFISDGTGLYSTTSFIENIVLAKSFKRNYLINGNFDIWQRNTSFLFTIGSNYCADRWEAQISGIAPNNLTITRSAFTPGQTAVPDEPTYYISFANPDVETTYLVQKIEGVRTLAGKRAYVEFYLKANNISSVSVNFYQYFGTGGSGTNVIFLGSISTPSSSWTKYSFFIDITSISGKTIGALNDDSLQLVFTISSGSYPNDFDFAHIGVYEAVNKSIVPPWQNRPWEQELALCQRYYEKSYNQATVPGTVTFIGSFGVTSLSSGAGVHAVSPKFAVTKRGTPTSQVYSPTTGAAASVDFAGATYGGIVLGVPSQQYLCSGLFTTVPATSGDLTLQWTADAEL